MTDKEQALIDAATEYAESYAGDDRDGVETDVINAFYAGSKYANQALVAAAYRSAADACELEKVDGAVSLEDAAYNNALLHAAGAILTLSQADAEAKLRELMLRVAEKVSNIPRGKTYSVEDIVAEVLNA